MIVKLMLQELRKEGAGAEESYKLREAVKILEKERELIEQVPDLQMDDTTKRLRQACFKANYKKRKIMSMESSSTNHAMIMNTQDHALTSTHSVEAGSSVYQEEEIKSLLVLSDCLSSMDHFMF